MNHNYIFRTPDRSTEYKTDRILEEEKREAQLGLLRKRKREEERRKERDSHTENDRYNGKTGLDLLAAARIADLKAIKECLNAGVPVNSSTTADGNAIATLLFCIGDSKKTMECLKFLVKSGADLNNSSLCIGGKFYTPMDVLALYVPEVGMPRDLYSVAKFVLTHGGKNNVRRDVFIKNLENTGIMSETEFILFEKIGDAYSFAKARKLEFDPEQITFGKSLGLQARLGEKTIRGKKALINPRQNKRSGNGGM